MGMTITEKILARHADKTAVQPGDNDWVNVDILMRDGDRSVDIHACEGVENGAQHLAAGEVG